ncbi:hypothetical protein JXR93_08125 [bacterium]|nr:hypothetical protein [bacterium]
MIEYADSSIHIKDTILWLDAIKKRALSFISHAHSEQMNTFHDRIIATKTTIEFYKKFVLKEVPLNALQMSFFRKFSIGDLTLTLYPSGHVPGAAQLFVKVKENKILYSGHINNRVNPICDEIYYPTAETLVLDSTYGSEEYIFPKRDVEESLFLKYVKKELENGYHIVILTNPFGKAQYLIDLLNRLQKPIYLQNKIYQYTQLFKSEKIIDFSFIKPLTSKLSTPSILLYPFEYFEKIPFNRDEYKKIALSGDAIFKDIFHSKYILDESFIISDHADFNGLIEYVKFVSPSKIYLMPSKTESKLLKQHLKELRFDVEELLKPKPKSLF